MIGRSDFLKPLIRVALFADSFYEPNGVATLAREFVRHAKSQNLALCCVHGGPATRTTQKGSVLTLELKRSFASFKMDADLYCDPLLNRYRNRMLEQVGAFQPDLIHITGPGDLGILGFWTSNLLKVPMVASWHTNLHEYAGRRIYQYLSFAPEGLRNLAANAVLQESLRALAAFYRLSHFILAPNQATVDLLKDRTGRPAYLMAHGVDVDRFSPIHRVRTDDSFRIGYVGRLTPEKNVRALVALEQSLSAACAGNFRFVLVGEGSERAWLRRNMKAAEFTGVLRDESLAQAFAGLDAFVFPSRTDTFGLVILEAMASGVPVVTDPVTGMCAGVEDGVTGFLAADFTESLLRLMADQRLRQSMSAQARQVALTRSWTPVFEDLYRTYTRGLESQDVRGRMNPAYRCPVPAA